MGFYYPTSVVYGSGQKFSFSQDQGSTYLGMSYTESLSFTPTLNVTEPTNKSIILPTQSNYPTTLNSFFMGSFDGFWIHKLYLNNHLVATVQTVNQEFFAPVVHDRIESVSMGDMDTSMYVRAKHHHHVPSPGPIIVLCLFAIMLGKRTAFRPFH